MITRKSAMIVLVFALLAACSKDKAQHQELDAQLRQLIESHELNQAFQPDHVPSKDTPELADLGGDLFFSPDLSLDGKVACVSCHHHDAGGADNTSLPVGLGGRHAGNFGDDRVAAARERFGDNVYHGLIPRNSPTVFNASLYRENLFWDGRAEYVTEADGETHIKLGFDVVNISPTVYERTSLLQAQARMPLSSPFEMKGGLHTEKNNVEIENTIIEFLRSSPVWCDKFNRAFGQENCRESLTLDNLTLALAEFQATLVFTDSPFQRYIDGDTRAITLEAKKGASLFLTPLEEGGMGCVACHSGKIFSDEKFHNIGIYASGVGANENGWDFGRRNVDRSAQRFQFKTQSLLNTAKRAPYFHNGSALTLQEAVMFHVQNDARDKAKNIIRVPGINYENINSMIEGELRAPHNRETYERLPQNMSKKQLGQILDFLESLTDDCLKDPDCIGQIDREMIETERPEEEKPDTVYSSNKKRHIDPDTVKAPVFDCQPAGDLPGQENKQGRFYFTSHDEDVGLEHERKIGLVRPGWLVDIINHGGMSVMDVTGNCLDDVIFDAGENGLVFYQQTKAGRFEKKEIPLAGHEGAITPLIMDLDGNYKYDLFVGNDGRGRAFIAFDFLGEPELMYFNNLSGPVINAALGDISGNGYMDMAIAFWRSYKSLLQDNIWINDGHGNLSPQKGAFALRESDHHASDIGGEYVRGKDEIPFKIGDVTFTPNFADIDLDGSQDLLLVADFVRSQALRNDNGTFTDITRRDVIDESNGMGVAIGDFNNNGLLDWYVTSINHENRDIGGNRLYINKGDGRFEKAAPDSGATVYENAWSWGACAADFNNNGYLDIFYVNGYGEPLKTAEFETEAQEAANRQYLEAQKRYRNSMPIMLINDKQGGFVNMSEELGFDEPFDGRGVACFDFEQDGDIDILVSPVEGKPRLYRNQLNGSRNWIAFRLVGLPGNTEAFGTKVHLYTEKGVQYREVRFENNYISRNPAQLHFGLGDLEAVKKVVIQYPPPNAREVTLQAPDINTRHIIYQADVQ